MATAPKQYKQGGNGSYGALNAKYNFLQTQLANLSGGSGGTQDLTSVLTLGNSAGNLDITDVDNIDVVTINGSAYPPVVPADDLQAVLTAGNQSNQQMILKDNLITPTSTLQINNSSIQHTATSSGTPLFFSTNQAITMTADNIDLDNVGRLIVPTLATGDYLDYNPTTANLTLATNNTGTPTNPMLTLNQNDTATGAGTMKFYKNLNVVGNDIGVITFNANTTTANNQEYARIASTIRSNTSGNLDGSIGLFARVNNSNTEFIRVNGVDSQTEFLQPVDMNTNAITNISTATAKTSLVVDNAVTGANATLTQSNLNINATGLNNNPVLTLNQSGVGSGILYEEFYNQRTAQTGEFNRMSYYAKNSAGVKTEFARIHQNAPDFTAGAVKGRLDFAVGNGAGLQDYLSLNANTGQVDILNSDLHLNSNDIVNTSSITTPLNYQYSKENVVYLSANTTAPVGESNLRYTAINLGKPPNWIEATSVTSSGFISGDWNITASQNGFQGYWWVGTEIGNVYYSNDSGATWTLQGSYGGRIRCFQTYQGGSNMAVGGDFTGTYNYLVGINSSLSSFDITVWGGMNNAVYCLYDNTGNSCLYIGGAFDDYFTLTGANYPKWITFDYNTSSWYSFSNTSGNGFFGGNVNSITQDATSGFIVVGGNFTTLIVNANPVTIPYLFTYQTPNGYDVGSYFSIGTTLNDLVSSVVSYSSGVLVGGNFTNPLSSPSWTDSYGIYITWNGTGWDLNNYLFSPSYSIQSIIHIPTLGIYYTITNSNIIYANTTQYATIPVGSAWNCVSYNGSSAVFATNSQSSVSFLFYLYDQSVGVNINSGAFTFNTTGGQFNNCYMTNTNSAVEMIWNSSNSKWFVISQESCSFS